MSERAAARAAARALNATLARAADLDEALSRTKTTSLNAVHCATALHRAASNRASLSAAKVQDVASRAAEILLSHTADAEAVNARTLTSIAWAVAKMRLKHARLRAALARRTARLLDAKALDAYGIANVAWAIATLHSSDAAASDETVPPPHPELLDALAEAACANPDALRPQEATNLMWAFATLRVRHARLFELVGAAAVRRMDEYTPQGVSQTLWACSKLGLAKHALFLAAAASARPQLRSYDAQSVATLAWAFANVAIEHGPLLEAVSAEARRRPGDFDLTSCSTLLWSLARLSDGVDPAAVQLLSRRLLSLASSGLEINQLLYALGALARLPAEASEQAHHAEGPSLATLLAFAAAERAHDMTANKLGICAWGLSRPAVRGALVPEAAAAWAAALGKRCAEVEPHLGWRSIGHIDVALRLLPPSSDGRRLDALLTEATARSVVVAAERTVRLNGRASALLIDEAPWRVAGLEPGARVLVAGFEPADGVEGALSAAGLDPETWRRFCASSTDAAAASWPVGGFSACALRWPWYAAGDAAAMAVAAVASVLRDGAPVWLAGNRDEGVDGAETALGPAFRAPRLAHSSDGAHLYVASRRAPGDGLEASKTSLEGWRTCESLALANVKWTLGRTGRGKKRAREAAQSISPWTVYPGLFAGGGLDVMTSALLDVLPDPPCGARIMDACCGSGVIAAVLAAAFPSASLHLLDADAVALDAARANVPSAKRVMLASVWPDTATAFPKRLAEGKGPKRYDWIVSNPPVHRGQPDCFDVVVELVRGARERLRRRGVLWIVAQEQVPVGCIMAKHGRFARVDAHVSADGRFVTWSGRRKN